MLLESAVIHVKFINLQLENIFTTVERTLTKHISSKRKRFRPNDNQITQFKVFNIL